MKTFFKTICVLLVGLIFFVGGPEAGAALTSKLPFQPGERLVYRAKWGFFSAGRVVMAVLPSRSEKGEERLHFTLSARTTPRIDCIYPIRDMQNSYTDMDLSRSFLYEKRSSGHRLRESRIDFDWKSMTATYLNSGDAEKTLPILPGTLDPLALIYAIRLKELRTGAVLEIPVTNGKGFNTLRADVTGRETITVDGKTYDTFVVETETESLKGLLEKRPQMKIWLTADREHVPVRLQTRHSFGRLSFELVAPVV